MQEKLEDFFSHRKFGQLLQQSTNISSFFTAEVLQHKTENQSLKEKHYDDSEVNGKFRITSEVWSKQLEDRNSVEFQELSTTLTSGLKDMLMENQELREKADFDVEIVKLT